MESPQKKKLLIVDDSAFMRKLISDFFEGHAQISVVGIARNGKDAINKIKRLKPDVVTLDVEMPEMNGLESLKIIMKEHPLPVIMLSSTTKRGTENTFKAMEYGAIDFVAKPSGTISLDLHKIREELIEKVLAASTISMSTLKKSAPKTLPEKTQIVASANTPFSKVGTWNKHKKKFIVIGTSTGGPRALQKVLTALPADIRAPILIVQHMPPGFTKSLAERLNLLSNIDVKEAEHGEIVRNGTAYIAPGGFHMEVKRIGESYSIVLNQEEPHRSGHRPSVDVLFESVAKLSTIEKIAVIMTGMGVRRYKRPWIDEKKWSS